VGRKIMPTRERTKNKKMMVSLGINVVYLLIDQSGFVWHDGGGENLVMPENNQNLIPPPSIGESQSSKEIPVVGPKKSKLWLVVLGCMGPN